MSLRTRPQGDEADPDPDEGIEQADVAEDGSRTASDMPRLTSSSGDLPARPPEAVCAEVCSGCEHSHHLQGYRTRENRCHVYCCKPLEHRGAHWCWNYMGVSWDEDEESDEDDYIDDIPLPLVNNRGPRASISAEAFGLWNKKEDFKPRIIRKTP